MLTETAKVLVVEKDNVWLQAQDAHQCSACSASAACGHSLLSKLHPARHKQIKVDRNKFEGKSGDTVTMGIDENLVLRLSALFYLMPLLSMLLLMLISELMGLNELLVIFAALSGLILSFIILSLSTRRNNLNSRYQAVLLPQMSGISKHD